MSRVVSLVAATCGPREIWFGVCLPFLQVGLDLSISWHFRIGFYIYIYVIVYLFICLLSYII